MERIKNISKIYDKLVDDESKALFQARLDFVFDRDYEKLINHLCEISSTEQFTNQQLETYFSTHDKAKVIIFGAGKNGRKCKRDIEKYNVRVNYYCDNDINKIGTIIDGITCLSVDEVCQNYKDYTVIPISPLYRKEMFDQLITGFFPQENILYLRGGELSLVCEKQYFDFTDIKPHKKNVFVDAGSYNGQTACDFIDWCDGKYDKIYCFEPNSFNVKNVEEKLQHKENIEIINAGTWYEEGELSFCCNGPASKIIDSNSAETICVTAIDDVVNDELVTFIKMDVEGAELESIIGAQKTIKNYKPDLAICIYHKWLDFIDLPAKLLEIVPEYRFAIRHYSNNTTETVLYAFVNEETEVR